MNALLKCGLLLEIFTRESLMVYNIHVCPVNRIRIVTTHHSIHILVSLFTEIEIYIAVLLPLAVTCRPAM